jgi:hypothetical protein
MTSASIFPEVKAINPATISQRKIGMYSITSSTDNVIKTQDISLTHGTGAEAKTDIKITTLNLFYGGKGGGGITTEFVMFNSAGNKVDALTRPAESTELENEITSSIMGIGFGITSNFGITILRSLYEFNANNEYSFNGSSNTYEYGYKGSSNIIKLGLLSSGWLNLGIFYEHAFSDNESINEGETQTSTSSSGVLGFGIGTTGQQLRMELNHERIALTSNEAQDTPPSKTSIIIETRIWGIALGYTGNYIVGGYSGAENSMYQNLVYQNSAGEPRFENLFNFSFGSSKGHSIGGSISLSKIESEEKNVVFVDDAEYTTTTDARGVALKYGYSY